MKKGSENFKESSILKVVDGLHKKGIKIRIYEPLIDSDDLFPEYELYNDFKKFDEDCDLIITNRYDSELSKSKTKIFCRDIYNEN